MSLVLKMQCMIMTKERDEVEFQGQLQLLCRGPSVRTNNLGLGYVK